MKTKFIESNMKKTCIRNFRVFLKGEDDTNDTNDTKRELELDIMLLGVLQRALIWSKETGNPVLTLAELEFYKLKEIIDVYFDTGNVTILRQSLIEWLAN